MTRVFVMTNHKGGVGKSTSATNIAFGMVQVLRQAGAANCRVLLIDTDSQGHASLVTTGRRNFGRDDSLYTLLIAERNPAYAPYRELLDSSPLARRKTYNPEEVDPLRHSSCRSRQ